MKVNNPSTTMNPTIAHHLTTSAVRVENKSTALQATLCLHPEHQCLKSLHASVPKGWLWRRADDSAQDGGRFRPDMLYLFIICPGWFAQHEDLYIEGDERPGHEHDYDTERTLLVVLNEHLPEWRTAYDCVWIESDL